MNTNSKNSTSSKDYFSLYKKYNFENQNSTSDIFYQKYLINKNSKSYYQSDKDYFSLYNKYKKKYLNLKNQIAGATSVNLNLNDDEKITVIIRADDAGIYNDEIEVNKSDVVSDSIENYYQYN